MTSKYPNCSNKYHMCCDTAGALATSSDKGRNFSPCQDFCHCFIGFENLKGLIGNVHFLLRI